VLTEMTQPFRCVSRPRRASCVAFPKELLPLPEEPATRLDRDDAAPPATRAGALPTRIHAYVEERLGDPGLTPAAIADAHHISLRYLYKVFEPEGRGVADWIRRRRLERCRRDLLDPALAERPVRATGARWGSPDAARFNRSFRAAYGLPPAEYRRSAGDGQVA
jgi:AraC-like DNA-binding protein